MVNRINFPLHFIEKGRDYTNSNRLKLLIVSCILVSSCIINAQTFNCNISGPGFYTMCDTIQPPPGGFPPGNSTEIQCSIPDTITCMEEVFDMVSIESALCNEPIMVEITVSLRSGVANCNNSSYRFNFNTIQICTSIEGGTTIIDTLMDDCEGITRLINDPPMILNSPQEATINCFEELQDSIINPQIANYNDAIGVSVSCDNGILVSHNIVTDPIGTCSGDTVKVEYIVAETDCTMRADTVEQIIIIVNQFPTLICPSLETAVCYSEIADTAALHLENILDTLALCTYMYSGAATIDDFVDNCPNTSYNVKYVIEESPCGRKDSCTYTITIDNDPPVITAFPPDITVGCIDEINLADTTDVSFTTSCSLSATRSVGMLVQNSTNPDEYNYTYSVTDECGRQIDSIQTITVGADMTPPTILACPPDTMIDCNASYPDTMSITMQDFIDIGGNGNDNCILDSLDLIVDATEVSTGNRCNRTLTRTYVLIDLDGNKSMECTQNIAVRDTIAPVVPDTFPDIAGLICGDTLPEITSFELLIDFLDDSAFFCPYSGSGTASGMLGCPLTGSGSGIDNCLPNADLVIAHTDIDTSGSICDGQTITRIYTISDSCNTSTPIRQVFKILGDLQPPVIDCVDIDTLYIGTDKGECYSTFLPDTLMANITDACGSGIDSVFISNPDTLQLGINTLKWVARDSCGRIIHENDACEQVVIVEDTESPTIACDTKPLELCLYNGNMTITPSMIVREVHDNCSPADSIEICIFDMNNNTVCGKEIMFGCDDVGTEIMMGIIATDQAGNAVRSDTLFNSNVCMRQVIVADCTAPIVNCFGTMTVDCRDTINTADLSDYGSVEMLISQNRIDESCPIDTVIELSPLDTFVCKATSNIARIITRRFEAIDASGNVGSCTQEIQVLNNTPFGLSDITWPRDTILNCMADTSVLALGRPTFDQYACSQVLTSHADMTFDLTQDICARIMRVWTLIDWCQFDRMGHGIFVDTQYVDIMSVDPPMIDTAIPDTLMVCAQDCSGGNFQFSFEGTAGCEDFGVFGYIYNIALDNGGVIQRASNNIDQILPIGTHSVILTIKDKCDNFSSESFTVIVKDCKAPAIVCIQGLVVNLMDTNPPMVPLWASDFSNGTKDNCTEESDIIFSFESENYETTQQRIFTCRYDDRTIPLDIYATDAHGNQSKCETTINVQANGLCPDDLTQGEETAEEENASEEETQEEESELEGEADGEIAMISGLIKNHKGEGIMNTEVNIQSGAMDEYKMTSEQGGYAFESLEMYNDYMIRPRKNDDILNGVSTLDLVLIQKHILGISLIEDPYLRIAADIDGSKRISARDLVELRKLILGSIETFSNNESWRFIDANYDMSSNDALTFPEEIEYFDLDQNEMSTDFVGVKIGDINGNSTTQLNERNIEVRSSEKMKLTYENTFYNNGENVIVSLKSNKDIALNGMQLAIKVDQDLELVDVISAELKISNDQYRIERDELLLSWNQDEEVNVSEGEEVFRLAFRAKSDGNVSNAIAITSDRMLAEVYDKDLSIQEIVLDAEGIDAPRFELYQNRPNPFIAATEIEFYLPNNMEATITAYDVKGQTLMQKSGQYTTGKNRIMITKDELGISSGVIYYRIQAGEFFDVKSMILIE